MPDPDWLKKMQAEGRVRSVGVPPDAFLSSETKTDGTATAPFGADHWSEKEFQARVCDLAHQFGWKVAHFRKVPVKHGDRVYWETPVAEDGKGFPDLMMVRAGAKPVWSELKVKGNTPSVEQWEWIHTLRSGGALAYVWYPSDWQQIVEVLGAQGPSLAPGVPHDLLRLADDGSPHTGDVEAA